MYSPLAHFVRVPPRGISPSLGLPYGGTDMEWASWSEFWDMGGYGFYVWGSYGVTEACILIEVMLLKRASGDTRRRLKRMQQWEEQ